MVLNYILFGCPCYIDRSQTRNSFYSEDNRVHYLYRKYLFYKGEWDFDIAEKKTKDYYSLIISNKAQLPSNAKNLKHDFGLSDEDLKIAYNLPHLTAQEPYVKSFQYKVLNSIYFTLMQNFLKLDISSMTKVLFARLKRKHYVTFSFTVGNQICCGKMLNGII